MPIKRSLGALAAACLLAGCSTIDTLRTTQGTGSPFTKVLTDEYRRLSIAEAEDRDWPDASYFVRKGSRQITPLYCVSFSPETYIVYFNFDDASLTPAARMVIDRVVADARKLGGLGVPNITVTGHSDLSGSAVYNMTLSLRRADAVRAALIERGFPAANIRIAGRGEGDQAVPTPGGGPEAKNRRAVIMML